MKWNWLISSIITLTTLPVMSWAQIIPTQASQATLEVAPRYPLPGEVVTVSLADFAIASQVNQITWSVDGEPLPDAENERSITLEAGEIGGNANVEALLMLANGQPRIATTNISPSRVLLTVEPETSAPSWYQGRPLPSVGSTVRVVAIPQTSADLPPSAYSYTWRINDSIANQGSIAGRFSETFTVPFGQGSTISVDVTDQAGTVVARRSVFVPSVQPQVNFYTTNPLRGQSALALTERTPLIGEELTVRAESFHFGSLPTADMFYEWEVNGRAVDNPSRDPQTITLQRGAGTAAFTVGFHMRNLSSLLQGAKNEFTVSF
jgi:hypothetical protein